MSHQSTPYSPNFPPSQGYGPPPENNKESYPMTAHGGYPGPPPSGPQLPPGAQPLPGMQTGFQPGFQPGMQPGYPHPHAGYPHPQPGYPQPGYGPVVQQPGPQLPPGMYVNVIATAVIFE